MSHEANNDVDKNNLAAASTSFHSAKEDNTIVTPYAFQVAPELLGKPLASPARRGVAQGIDLLLLYFISSANGLVLGALAAITFLRAASNLSKGKKRSTGGKILRACSACLIGWIIFTTLDGPKPYQISRSEADEQETAPKLRPAVTGISSLIMDACDNDLACLREVTEGFIEVQADLGASLSELKAIQARFLEKSSLNDTQKAELTTLAENHYWDYVASLQSMSEESTEQTMPAKIDAATEESVPEKARFFDLLRDWLHDGQDFLGELGLGVGWAALYYSVFTAYLQGCTPGKWITRIRVMRLDGRPPTLWESFGRYGGYGAGFATGMLGFFQIYWDANRQSIQDKIAETLVVRYSVKVLPEADASDTSGTSGEGI